MEPWQETLVGLILDDPSTVSAVLAGNVSFGPLDGRTEAMVRMAAACATGASGPTFARIMTDALDAGANEDDVIRVLVACAPLIGASRLVRSAPAIAAGLHFDVDGQLESLDEV
jgi:alkylhydroperoxidase/carboxymuconolactone decarboxylase family protein YurZ